SGERRAGDQAGIVGGQEYDAAPDLFRFAEAADRYRRQDTVLKNVFRHRLYHFGVDVTGSDGIDGDADARAFLCQRLGEANLAGLGGRIIGLPELALLAIETDVFMRTVGFALTGSDDAAPKVIGNRAKCVFAINNDIFHLNNVHIDRLAIQGWQRQQGLEQWVTVDLHGDDIVFEDTTEPLK